MLKIFRNIIFFVIAALIVPLFPVIAEESPYIFTFSQAKDLAVNNSPKIKNHLANQELIRVNERDAWIAYEQARANYQNTGGKSDTLKNAMDAAKKAYDAAVYAREDGTISLDNLKKQVEYEIESLFFDLLNMDNSVEIMEESYKIQSNMVKVENIKLNLGMSTIFSVDQQKQKAMELERQLNTLYNAKTTLKWQFNRNIGRLPEEPLELAPVTFNAIEHENQQAGEAKAKDASLAIDQYNRTIEDKSKERQDKLYTASDKVEKLDLEIDQIELQIDSTEYNIELTMKTLHENLYLAQKKLVDTRLSHEIAEKNYLNIKLQYEIGMISKIVYDSENITHLQKDADYEKAVYDYYLATRKVNLAENGIILN